MGQYFTSGELETLLTALGHDRETLKVELVKEKEESTSKLKEVEAGIKNLFQELSNLKLALKTHSKYNSNVASLIKKL